MDRWEDADDDITPMEHSKGRVARMGIAGFVQAAVSASVQSADADPPQQGIVIVDSKREQRAAAAQLAMPPPPAVVPRPAAGVSIAAGGGGTAPAAAIPVLPRPAVPAGSLPPPPGTLLLVHKAGSLVQRIPITQVMTVFGRLPCNDITLDHASVSRQHAALTFRQQQQEGQQHQQPGVIAILCDLGSAHGTFIQGTRVTRGQPCPLEKGDVFHFGASTRTYSIQVPVTADTGSGKAGSKKRPRVTFAGDDDVDADTTPGSHDHGKRRSLEQVIGYSDSNQFTPRVGPQAAPGYGSEQGKFAYLLESKVVVVKSKTMLQFSHQQATVAGAPKQQAGTADKDAADGAASLATQHDVAANQLSKQQERPQVVDTGQDFHSTAADTGSAPTKVALGQQQQQGTRSVLTGSGVVHTWSGGQSRLLLPPQLARKNSGVQQHAHSHQQKHGGGIGSSLYDQLPAAAAETGSK